MEIKLLRSSSCQLLKKQLGEKKDRTTVNKNTHVDVGNYYYIKLAQFNEVLGV